MLYPVELRGQPWERQSFCSGSEVASGLYQAWSLQGGDLGLRAWRGLPDGVGRASLGTAAVRVSARWMSWLIPWSGWHDHPGFTHQTCLSLTTGLRAALRSRLLPGQAGFGS